MIIGISGGRGAGKSTLSRRLAEILPNSLLIIVDDYMHESSKNLEVQIFNNLGIKKEPKIFSYNYYFKDFESVKVWISTIEDEVIERIETEIENNVNKEYIIIDWCFLPLCKFFNKCDYKICLTADFNTRKERVTRRLLYKDVSLYNRNDVPLASYSPDMYVNSIKYTDLSGFGYKFDYNLQNNSSMKDFNIKINQLAEDFSIQNYKKYRIV